MHSATVYLLPEVSRCGEPGPVSYEATEVTCEPCRRRLLSAIDANRRNHDAEVPQDAERYRPGGGPNPEDVVRPRYRG